MLNTKKNRDPLTIAFFLFWGTLIIWFGATFISWTNGNLYVKGAAQWMDIPVHEAYMQHFLNTPMSEWFAVHPLNINEKFTYHFLPDLISAYLQKAGFSITWSLALPVIITCLGFLHESFFYFKDKHGSSTTAALIVSSFFLFGGIGFAYRIINPDFFVNFPYETSFYISEKGLVESSFPNVLTGMFFSQRGLAFGLWLFFFSIRRLNAIQNPKVIFQILLANFVMMLSLIHGSMALHFYLGLSFLQKPTKQKFVLLLTLFIESIVIFLLFFKSSVGNGYLGFIDGLYFGPSNYYPWMLFWIASTFLLLPLVITFFLKSGKLDQNIFFAIFIFALINIVTFQPNRWDNVKLFLFALIFFYEYIVIGLQAIGNIRVRYTAMALSFVCLWGSGIWDIYEVTFTKKLEFQLYSQEDVQLAERLKKILPASSTVVIENKHNHMALQLLPNHPLLGFSFNISTYGHDQKKSRVLRDQINNLLRGGDDPEFIKQRNIGAIFVRKNGLYSAGRESMRVAIWNSKADIVEPNIPQLREKYPLMAENKDYLVFSTMATRGENSITNNQLAR